MGEVAVGSEAALAMPDKSTGIEVEMRPGANSYGRSAVSRSQPSIARPASAEPRLRARDCWPVHLGPRRSRTTAKRPVQQCSRFLRDGLVLACPARGDRGSHDSAKAVAPIRSVVPFCPPARWPRNEGFSARGTLPWSVNLSDTVEKLGFGKIIPDAQLASLWTERNDAQNYVLLGDPAATLKID
jgi:hypothetical protein